MLLLGVALPVRALAASLVLAVLAVLGAEQLVDDVRHRLPAAPFPPAFQLRPLRTGVSVAAVTSTAPPHS